MNTKKISLYIIVFLMFVGTLVSLCFVPISASKLIPTIEEQIANDLGVKVHIEKLILRVGPKLKVKTPIMHIMYEDGQKFAQFDNVKFYIPWYSLLQDSPRISLIKAKKLNIKVASDDKFLSTLLDNLQDKNFHEIPNIKLKEYSFSYYDKVQNNKYTFVGNNFELDKIFKYKNFKLKTKGNININSLKYITYDIIFVQNLEPTSLNFTPELMSAFEQLKNFDFHSDLIADIKLYKNTENLIQASGFINLDNISVLDKEKKNPKSFVYLTLWGDRASVLSNIYTSANKKIYVEGMINNSQKPVLDLKVKTDEINIKDLYSKLRIFMDLSKIKDIASIEGTLNANFALKGDLNKIKSSGFMKIANGRIISQSLNIDKINSEIDFSNNSINIIKAVGEVNNSPVIVKGSINKEIDLELLMNNVELKYLLPPTSGIKEGVISLIAKLNGPFKNIIHKENLAIQNLVYNKDGVNISLDSIKLDTNKNNVALVNNVVCKTNETEDIKIPSLKFYINQNNIKLPETNIYMPNSNLVTKGELLNFNNNNLTFVTSINGFINSKDIKRFSNNSTRYPLKLILSGNKLFQNISAQILFEKTDVLDEPTILNLSSKLEKNNLKIDDLSLLSFSGRFLDDLKANIKGSKKITLTGVIENLKKPAMKNIRIFIPQQLNLNIYDTLAQVKGDVFINGVLDKPEIIGQIYFHNLFNQSMQLSLSNTTFDFNKNNVIINAPQVKLADSTMGINALLSTDFSESLLFKNINIKSKFLNTDTLLMYKDTPFLNAYPIKINEGKLYCEKASTNIYGSQLYLASLIADFNLKNELIKFENIKSELFNGKLSATLSYNLHDEQFDAKIMGRGVSSEPIFNIVSSREDSISGTMDFDTDLRGELTSKESLNGNIKFIVSNGRMSSLGKLEHLLYAQNVIADNMLRTSLSVVTKAITLRDTGLFKYLRGDVDLNNGLATINMLQTQGPLMSLYIRGLYNTVNDYAKLVILGRLSDEVVSGLGAFGDFSFKKLMVMLTGEDSKSECLPEDFDKIPQLASKNTKEFKSIINGIIDKPSSVITFNWISYTQKTLKQKEVPMTNIKIPDFVEALPY